MIIQALLDTIWKVFTTIWGILEIPAIPEDIINQVTNTFTTILDSGAKLIDLFLVFDVAKILLGIVIAIEIAIGIYDLVMWVLTKIPMAGVSR